MIILSSLLFAISANTDNFVVGLTYGIKRIKIGWLSNLLIALISLLGTVISMCAGKLIFNFIPEIASNFIGGIILILIGAWSVFNLFFSKKTSDGILENPENADKDNSLNIDVKESVILALALTINNIGLGVGASITGLNIVLTSNFTFFLSLVMIEIGYVLGSRFFSKLFCKKATLISGLIIIALGVYEMLI